MSAPRQERSALSISLRTALIMVLFTLAFTTLMALIYTATKSTIEASAETEKLKLIGEVLPAAVYDNDLLQDYVVLPATPALGLDQPTRIYRARKHGAPAALVFETAAADGYSGHIGLILAVRESGALFAVRVTRHRETPGLGDYIDPRKDKDKARPWIGQFDSTGFAEVPPAQWRVKKDGGHFEQRAGATISARAVTNAVGRALQWAAANRARLFAASANSTLAQP